jgi:putative addiction module component (TIGR02574 family)
MAHYSVTVPENKIHFFEELMLNLNLEGERTDDFELSDAQKSVIDQRLENYKNNPDSYLDWKDVQKDIEKRL